MGWLDGASEKEIGVDGGSKQMLGFSSLVTSLPPMS